MQSVASISKVMTAIIAVEHASLEDFVEIDAEVSYADGSSVYLQAGQIVSLRSLLYGLLLRSGNDAALAIAKYIGGNDVERFVSYMNDKAALLGMNNTFFTNPSGLDDDGVGNQSTPYDMTLLMCASLKYPALREIMSTKTYKTEYANVWSNKNRLLSLYPYIVGGKTGFTKKAGRTLISAADNGFPIAIATFRKDNDFVFHRDVYTRLYETYQSVVLVKRGVYFYKNRKYQVEQDLSVIVAKFNPDKVSVSFDATTNDLIVSYKDGGFHQEYRVKGRKNQ